MPIASAASSTWHTTTAYEVLSDSKALRVPPTQRLAIPDAYDWFITPRYKPCVNPESEISQKLS
ncbi:hypothetical protein E4U17_005864 [Claviceps sp. LM77 group G4]|nr:hypothetical protein E4U17_005864 [Claviceps sp. LM77 group G4]KAG6073691.1 hypothetical protein E4U33_002795 [Claviceps sp. LM78 group G4]KAG6081835.1 hypothetical protein E4U16_006928 [Claviceps sp. LM84 group G4]